MRGQGLCYNRPVIPSRVLHLGKGMQLRTVVFKSCWVQTRAFQSHCRLNHTLVPVASRQQHCNLCGVHACGLPHSAPALALATAGVASRSAAAQSFGLKRPVTRLCNRLATQLRRPRVCSRRAHAVAPSPVSPVVATHACEHPRPRLPAAAFVGGGLGSPRWGTQLRRPCASELRAASRCSFAPASGVCHDCCRKWYFSRAPSSGGPRRSPPVSPLAFHPSDRAGACAHRLYLSRRIFRERVAAAEIPTCLIAPGERTAAALRTAALRTAAAGGGGGFRRPFCCSGLQLWPAPRRHSSMGASRPEGFVSGRGCAQRRSPPHLAFLVEAGGLVVTTPLC
jgi:hypothetical protein